MRIYLLLLTRGVVVAVHEYARGVVNRDVAQECYLDPAGCVPLLLLVQVDYHLAGVTLDLVDLQQNRSFFSFLFPLIHICKNFLDCAFDQNF